VEFGVYKGKSATIIGFQIRPGERFVLVDVERYITDDTLQALPVPAEFVQCRSEDFSSSFGDYRKLGGQVRFLHVDSSHAYRTTLGEMAMADELLSADGVLCLDDYSNLNYSQILPAVYKYLFTTDTDLTPFLVTGEKCYLCRRAHFEKYGGYVLERLVDDMRARKSAPVTLARTDADPEYSAFYLRPSLTPDEGRHYGEAIYGHLYRSAAPLGIRRTPAETVKRGLRRFMR